MRPSKLLVLGLDCATPQLVFERWRQQLPHLDALMREGVYGPLRSCIPPITIPAWTCMFSGKHPGTLGCYGFRNRSDYSYDGMTFATARSVTTPRVWDIASAAGKHNLIIGVPQTYPPRPLNGAMVSCFLTPDIACRYTWPPELADEITRTVGEYLLDVDNFRSDNKAHIIKQVYAMTDRRFTLLQHLMRTRPWDLAIMVEMGIDRMHHAFWKYMDPEHPLHRPGSPYADAIRDYYIHLDRLVGQTISQAGDDTSVMIVSDHGAQPMRGGFCINEWLQQEGYLQLRTQPASACSPDTSMVDWPHTRAWGEGGYYSRIFLNVRDREPEGTIPPERYEQVRDELADRLAAVSGPDGQPLGITALKPETIYSAVNGIPPDLIVYIADLSWRAIATIGSGCLFTCGNDAGPDDANHAQHGIVILRTPHPGAPHENRLAAPANIVDIAPTILELLGLAVPADMEGCTIATAANDEQVYTCDEEAVIRKRLSDLGYM